MTRKYSLLILCAAFLSAPTWANVPTSNTWTITASDDNGAVGTVTDASVPSFSADFSIVRRNVVSFAGATWTGGAEINVLNAAAGVDPGTGDSIEYDVTFSNVQGGSIVNIVSEYGTTTNNDLDATWTYTFPGGGLAELIDPDNQMVEPNGTLFPSGGFVTNATSELGAAAHTWCVVVPANNATLSWASPTHAFAEAMAFRIEVAQQQLVTVPVPTLSTWSSLALALGLGLMGFVGIRRLQS